MCDGAAGIIRTLELEKKETMAGGWVAEVVEVPEMLLFCPRKGTCPLGIFKCP